MTKPALAEFEIQESQVEKGEIELEYRGAVHWGFDKQTEAEVALQEEEEALSGKAAISSFRAIADLTEAIKLKPDPKPEICW